MKIYLDIADSLTLAKKESDIKNLFQSSFGSEFSTEEWRWFYLENPAGPAYVALLYEEGQLIGHYAVIPTRMLFNGVPFVAYRSMTTMVHPVGRGRGLFTELAGRVYAMLGDAEKSLVYGFPNMNSAHGFEKYLDWKLLPSDNGVDVSGAEILKDSELLKLLTRSAEIKWDTLDESQARWRMARPGAKMMSLPGLVTKKYEGVENILHLDDAGISSLDPGLMYRVLLPDSFRPEVMRERAIFKYRFGYRIFDNHFNGVNFKRELIMSDVF